MGDFMLEGIGSISGGTFDTVRIEGIGSCSEDMKVVNLNIEGIYTCSGKVDVELLYCEGMAEFKADIRAKKISIEGIFNQSGNTKIEASEILCQGVIKTSGEISTDVLDALGCVEAREIVGDHIKICSRKPRHRFFVIGVRSKIKVIEATTIELYGVKSTTVNGKDIIIGEKCVIETVDCCGTLFIDESAVVKNITGEYTRKY